jgi:hypothetical protein
MVVRKLQGRRRSGQRFFYGLLADFNNSAEMTLSMTST